jgi:hypothetical protein
MNFPRPAVLFVLMITLSHCGRTQDKDKLPPSTTADSIRTRKSFEEKSTKLKTALDRVMASMESSAGMEDADRLIHAEYSYFKSLSVIARSLDVDDQFRGEINEEEKRLAREDSTRAGQAGRITNGMLGIYSMYGIVYRMHFGYDEAKMKILDDINRSVIAKMRPKIPAIEAVAVMSASVFKMSLAIMRDIDRDSLYAASFELIEQQNEEGNTAAETDEDRFLNGLYRTFEVSQLWALSLDPSKRVEISELNKKLAAETQKSGSIARQMAVAMEHLYKIHDFIARRILQ